MHILSDKESYLVYLVGILSMFLVFIYLRASIVYYYRLNDYTFKFRATSAGNWSNEEEDIRR